MNKETIAKIQVIAGVILIVLTICIHIYYYAAGVSFIQTAFQQTVSTASEYAHKNMTTEPQIMFYMMQNGLQFRLSLLVIIGLGILLDIIILAQSAILITSGLSKLAEK